MGIFADVKATAEIQRIKTGGTARLSIASITNCIINTMDARNNLPSAQYDAVCRLYLQMRKCTTKMEMDYDGYLATCVDILKEFDKIAPCECYLGLPSFEASLLMNEVRNIYI